MTYEFEGKTEEEAIDIAISTLGVSRDKIKVELAESKKQFSLFGKKKVKICVYVDDNIVNEIGNEKDYSLENDITIFLSRVIEKMGIQGKVIIKSKNPGRFFIDIVSSSSAVLIGKKGKTLEALQLIANVYINKKGISENPKIILDTENYRQRREKSLVSFAQKMANVVKKTKRSVLLEAMNPFERRLIHTALNSYKDVETVSEGDGLYKKIRVVYKGK